MLPYEKITHMKPKCPNCNEFINLSWYFYSTGHSNYCCSNCHALFKQSRRAAFIIVFFELFLMGIGFVLLVFSDDKISVNLLSPVAILLVFAFLGFFYVIRTLRIFIPARIFLERVDKDEDKKSNTEVLS